MSWINLALPANTQILFKRMQLLPTQGVTHNEAYAHNTHSAKDIQPNNQIYQ
jgi:hypothetical protein